MKHIEFKINDKRISIYGNNKQLEEAEGFINGLDLTGNEAKDRLMIQKCIDDHKLKAHISYDGNTVLSYDKIVKGYRKLQKETSLKNLTNEMYDFFTGACGDIAHYDLGGYKHYYNFSLQSLEETLLNKNIIVPSWKTDADRIFKKLKIGKYYDERLDIDINVIPINKVKDYFKEQGVTLDIKDDKWYFTMKKSDAIMRTFIDGELVPVEEPNNIFSFDIEVKEVKPLEVLLAIKLFHDKFDKDKYVLDIYNNKSEDDKRTLSDIVFEADIFMKKITRLVNNIFYKCQCEAEIMSDYNKQKEVKYDLELEI